MRLGTLVKILEGTTPAMKKDSWWVEEYYQINKGNLDGLLGFLFEDYTGKLLEPENKHYVIHLININETVNVPPQYVVPYYTRYALQDMIDDFNSEETN
jgi:hypothetical protein